MVFVFCFFMTFEAALAAKFFTAYIASNRRHFSFEMKKNSKKFDKEEVTENQNLGKKQ